MRGLALTPDCVVRSVRQRASVFDKKPWQLPEILTVTSDGKGDSTTTSVFRGKWIRRPLRQAALGQRVEVDVVQGGDQHIRLGGWRELLVIARERPSAAIPPALAAWIPDTASSTTKRSTGGTPARGPR